MAAAAPNPVPSLAWLRSLPKVEMHAHLSGSVRDSTIHALLAEEARELGQAAPSVASSSLSTFVSGERNLSQCFEVFALLHRLLSTLPAVARAAREVVADFAADEVVYLELRTTPRALPKGNTTKREYVDTVVQVLRECEQTIRTPSGRRIHVRLLLSIDRSGSQADAESTVDLAIEFARQPNPVVVGLDFSGNPLVSSFRAFEAHFERARAAGLKCSIHVGEKADDAADLDAVLGRFRPERIGHVVCLEPRHTDMLLQNPIPIEICPTSNLKTKIVQQLEQHPFGVWRSGARNNNATAAAATPAAPNPYPLVVCTDDSGVFNITLSDELHRLAEAFRLDAAELLQLETRALEIGFADEECKRQLRETFAEFAAQQSSASSQAAAAPASAASDLLPIAILTSADDDAYKASDRALLAAFASAGIPAEHVVWSAPDVEWSRFRGCALRSTWDIYLTAETLEHFLDTLARIEAAGVMLANPLATVRWNHDKRYLLELASLGLPSVDSLAVEDLSAEHAALRSSIKQKGWEEGVIKPMQSASGMHTYRFNLMADDASPSSLASVLSACLESGVRRWLVQPFMREVLTEGEWSFVFIEGEHSHTVLSVPAAGNNATPAWEDAEAQRSPEEAVAAREAAAAAPSGFMVQECHGGSFRYVQADAALIKQARDILHATPYGRDCLYARVDCLRRADSNTLVVSELELIEPELFGRGVPGFQQKLTDAIQRRIKRYEEQKKQTP